MVDCSPNSWTYHQLFQFLGSAILQVSFFVGIFVFCFRAHMLYPTPVSSVSLRWKMAGGKSSDFQAKHHGDLRVKRSTWLRGTVRPLIDREWFTTLEHGDAFHFQLILSQRAIMIYRNSDSWLMYIIIFSITISQIHHFSIIILSIIIFSTIIINHYH